MIDGGEGSGLMDYDLKQKQQLQAQKIARAEETRRLQQEAEIRRQQAARDQQSIAEEPRSQQQASGF